MPTDWFAWHDYYRTKPRMRQRLQIVRDYVLTCLNACSPGTIRVLSVCAGDGRDLLGALLECQRATDVYARFVELDSRLVECGRATVAATGLEEQLEFVNGDATLSSVYEGAIPADLVLVCGVFGNVPETELPRLIHSLCFFCKQGSFIIWTRDLTENADHRLGLVRELLHKSGFEEVTFKITSIGNMGVGTHRYLGQTLALPKDEKLFVFSSPLDTQEC